MGEKTKGRHLRGEKEARLYRQQIDRFRSFQDLSRRLVETGQALADAEAETRRNKIHSNAKSGKKSSVKSMK